MVGRRMRSLSIVRIECSHEECFVVLFEGPVDIRVERRRPRGRIASPVRKSISQVVRDVAAAQYEYAFVA